MSNFRFVTLDFYGWRSCELPLSGIDGNILRPCLCQRCVLNKFLESVGVI
jgi:hypothetical protein